MATWQLQISIIILSHIWCTISATNTTSPTQQPTNEPTSEPTLEPTINPVSITTTDIPVPSPSQEPSSSSNKSFLELYYIYFIIGGSAIYCICLLCLACFMRRKHNKAHLNKELEKTNAAIRESKYKQPGKDGDVNNNSNDEQQPMTGSVSPRSQSNQQQEHNNNNYSNQLKQSQLSQLQQMQQLQSYQQYTNFQNPYNIAAYQALQFCPPMNHDGSNWKQLDHLNPQQRMMQLMRQQQYIQQMANQAAIAMGYFLEHQQKMQQMQMDRQSQYKQQQPQQQQQQKPQNYKDKSPMHQIKHRAKVASVSYVEEEQHQNGYPMSLPQQQQNIIGSDRNIGNNVNHPQFAMSAPNENKLKMPDPPKAKRLDTMDDVLLAQDLPPSVVDGKNGVLSNVAGGDDDFKFGAGGEKTLLELDPRDRPDVDINMDEKGMNVNIDININDNDAQNEPLVPPPNPMEMKQLNVGQPNMNMRKIESLPPSIPDLPFVTTDDNYYDDEYQQ